MSFDLREILAGTPVAGDVRSAKTTVDERKLLRHLAASRFTGEGCIADVGCGTGASTLALCEGLADNLRVGRKQSRIHAFDRFRPDPRYHRAAGTPDLSRSFLPEFVRNVAPYREFCEIHEGDVCEARPEIGPVEILHVDMAKDLATFRCIASRFYPLMIAGRTVLLHQDFGRPRLAWLHYSTGFLLPYFELTPRLVETTLVLELVEPIPAGAVARLAADEFSIAEKTGYIGDLLRVFERRAEGHGDGLERLRALLDLATAYVYYWEGEYDEAERRADRLEGNPFLDPTLQFMFREVRSRGTMF